MLTLERRFITADLVAMRCMKGAVLRRDPTNSASLCAPGKPQGLTSSPLRQTRPTSGLPITRAPPWQSCLGRSEIIANVSSEVHICTLYFLQRKSPSPSSKAEKGSR